MIAAFSVRNVKQGHGTDFTADLYFGKAKVASVSDTHFGAPYEVEYTSDMNKSVVEFFLASNEARELAHKITTRFREKNKVDLDKPMPDKLAITSFIYYLMNK